jgi:hypothetical protein
MAVTSCSFHVRDFPKRAVFSSPASSVYVDSYLIITDDPTDDQFTVAGQATFTGPNELPGVGEEFPTDGNSFVRRIELTQTRENSTHWIAIVTYEPRQPGEFFDANPLDRPVRDHWEYREVEETRNRDKDGNIILNNAGMPFPDPIVVNRSESLLVLKKNYATRAEIDTLNATFHDTVNDATWYSQPAKTWRYLHTTSSEVQTENGFDFYDGVTRIQFDPDGWDWNLTEEGFEHLNAAAGDLVRPVDNNGLQMIQPVKLAADGTRAADGAAAINTTVAIFTPVDYTTMGLGG